MEPSENEVIEYDIRGQICPSCLLLTLDKINQIGATLKSGGCAMHVVTDSRYSTSTIPEAVSNMGFSVEVEKEGDHYRIKITGGR